MNDITFDCPKCGITSDIRLTNISNIFDGFDIQCPVCFLTFVFTVKYEEVGSGTGYPSIRRVK